MRATIAALLYLAGCNLALGVEELPRGTPTLRYVDDACRGCIEKRCAESRDGCLDDSACFALHDCLAQCPIHAPGCRGACEKESPGVIDEALPSAFDQCRREQCTAECLGHRGLIDHWDDSDCAACAEDACVVEATSCVVSGSCERHLGCMQAQPDPNRVDQCHIETGSPRGSLSQGTGPLVDCMAGHCGSECTITHDVSCFHAWDWDRTSEDSSVKYELRVTDNIMPSGFPGADVTACPYVGGSLSCPKVLDQNTTDESGSVVLQFDFKTRMFFKIGHPEIFPHIYAPDRPFRRTGVVNTTIVLDTDYADDAEEVIGAPLDPTRGALTVYLFDCGYHLARGVEVELSTGDDPVVRTYLHKGLVDRNATETHDLGQAGFTNVKPGVHSVEGLLDGKVFWSADAVVTKGTITEIDVFPETRP